MLQPDHKTRIEAALRLNPAVSLSWQRDSRSPKPISKDELESALREVEKSQTPTWITAGTYKKNKKEKQRWRSVDVGLSISRLQKTLKCHRAKAAKLLAILSELGLIYKAANYRAGHRGNVYRPVLPGHPVPQPTPPQSYSVDPSTASALANTGDDDPWG